MGFKGTLRANSLKPAVDIKDEDDYDCVPSKSLWETSSIYKIQVILCSSQYTIGKSVQEYLVSFHQQYKNLKESSELLPGPLESVQDLINDLVHTLNMDFNLGKDQTKEIVPYTR